MSEQADLAEITETESDDRWTSKSLGDIFENIYSGGTPKTGVNEYYDGDIPFVKIEDLNAQKLGGVTTAEEHITKKAIEETTVRAFEKGALLFTIYGSLAETALVRSEVATNQAILGLWGAERDNVLYVKYAIDKHQPRLESLSRQTTQANLGKGIVEKYQISTPPLEEQRKIASVLYTVDQAIQKTEDIISRLERIRTGALRDLFTRGTGDNDTRETPMGEFPQNWEMEQMSSVGKLINGNAFPKEHQGREDGDYPFVKVSDTNDYRRYVTGAKNYISEAQADDIGCNIHPEGTVILPKRGAAIMTNKRRILAQECAVDNNQIGIVGNDVEPLFLYYYLSDVDMGRFVQDGAVKSLTKSLLSMIRVPVPPKETQSEIVEILDGIDTYIEAEVRVKTRYEQLKEGLVQDLLSGEIRTNDKPIEVVEEVLAHG